MYKVYFNERLLHFVAAGSSIGNYDLILRLYGNENPDQLRMMIRAFEENYVVNEMIFICEHIDKSWKTFTEFYLQLEAAGGIVYNDERQILMIFRNGKWDLPKGKIEKGEDAEKAAVREIFEECGISASTLVKQLPTTYHTYPFQGENVLKTTYWFLMTTKDLSTPVPQLEEGITEAKWMDKSNVQNALENTYLSISNLLKEKEINESPGLLE